MVQAQIEDINRILHDAYYTPSSIASFRGVQPLLNEVNRILAESNREKIPRSVVSDWLTKQDSYTTILNARRHFPTNPYHIPKLQSQMACDLIDLSKYASHNDNNKWLLVCLNNFSRFAWVTPLLSKDASSVLQGLKHIISLMPVQHETFESDSGKEFYNKLVKAYLSSVNMKMFSKGSAWHVERFNRTLLSRIYRYMTAKNTRAYLPVLQSLVDSYNRSYHTGIAATPFDVLHGIREPKNIRTEKQYRKQLSKYARKDRARILPINQLVKLSYDPHHGNPFQKSYHSRWTSELFRVSQVLDKPGERLLYKLRDLTGEEISNSFYRDELTPVHEDFLSQPLHIKNIHRYRGKGSKREALVSWVNYPANYKSWEPVSSVQDI